MGGGGGGVVCGGIVELFLKAQWIQSECTDYVVVVWTVVVVVGRRLEHLRVN